MRRKTIGTAALGAALALGLIYGAPARADPAAGGTTVVVIPLPGPLPAQTRSGPDESYRPPAVKLVVQDVDGGGVDRDGTSGYVYPDGTVGTITGPLMTAVPQVRADPPPMAAGERPMPR